MSTPAAFPQRPGDQPGHHPVEALYIHVPFCRPICPFCAFAVHGDKPELHRPYLDAVGIEMAQWEDKLGNKISPLRSVYIGGGTPSRLSLEEFEVLISRLRSHFPLTQDAEIAVELNPEDVTRNFVEGLIDTGFTRLSLGLQSLDNATLKILGRGHTAEQGERAVNILLEYGPSNINIDLMFGTPEVGFSIFLNDLEKVIGWGPAHLSLYGLDIEPGTLYARNRRIPEWIDAHLEKRNTTYLQAAASLADAGYRHYEVSNFCLPGMEGRQNLIVWGGGNYLGFGPGAHAHVNGFRAANVRHLRSYLARLQVGDSPRDFSEETSTIQQANEALMLALRSDTGLDVTAWSTRFGITWGAQRDGIVQRLEASGQATRLNERLALTPRGFLVADAVAAALAVEA